MEKVCNIYIATLPRSGSTLLGEILNQHRSIIHSGESSYWGKVNPNETMCGCGEMKCPFLLKVQKQLAGNTFPVYQACSILDKFREPAKEYHRLSLSFGEEVINNPEKLKNLLDNSVCQLEKIAGAYRTIGRKDIVIDNTKEIVLAGQLVTRSQWKIIVLVRDPRGLAYSNMQAGIRKGVRRDIESKIPVYVEFATRALALLQMPNVFLVKYENLCENREKEIKKVCNFLDVCYEPSMLKFKTVRGHTLMGNRLRFDDCEEIKEDKNWIRGLDEEEKELISKDAAFVSLFYEFGYKL